MVHIRGTSLSLLYPPGTVPWLKIHPEVSSPQYIWWYPSRITKGKCWDTPMTLRTSCMAIWSKPADANKTVSYIYSIPSRQTYYIHPYKQINYLYKRKRGTSQPFTLWLPQLRNQWGNAAWNWRYDHVSPKRCIKCTWRPTNAHNKLIDHTRCFPHSGNERLSFQY